MGCWNETCMLTGLPILAGEKAVGVFVTRKPGADNACYSDSFYVPVSLPFYGEYNDYGSLEDLERDDKALIAFSMAGLYEKKGDKYGPAGPSLAGYDKFLSGIMELAVQGQLYIRQDEAREPVRLALMRREFFDFLVGAMDLDEDQVTGNVTFRVRLHAALRKPLQEGTLSAGDILPLARLIHAMDLQRLSWRPPTGAGSQSCLDLDWQERFYSKMAETAASLRMGDDA